MAAVCAYLTIKRCHFWRQNTAGVFDPTRQTWRALSPYAMRGVSDLILLKDGKAIFLEVKSAIGKLSPDQIKFKAFVEEAGSTYYTIRSIDDVMKLGL